MYLVPHFGHSKVYETSVWTPCFQILAKTMTASLYLISKADIDQPVVYQSLDNTVERETVSYYPHYIYTL